MRRGKNFRNFASAFPSANASRTLSTKGHKAPNKPAEFRKMKILFSKDV